MEKSSKIVGWRTSSRGGFTLIEVLIASVLFSVIVSAVYLMYSTSHTTFTQGDKRADLQQNVRIALDKMVSELRMAGFGATATNPTTLRPAIFDAAANRISFRADIDNGHSFLTAAAASGATSITVSQPEKYTSGTCGPSGSNKGDYIVITDTDGDNWEAGQVNSKSGPTLTLCQSLSRAYPLGSSVYKVKSILYTHVAPASGQSCDPKCSNCKISREIRAGQQPSPPSSVPQPLACNIESLTFTYYDSNNADISLSSFPTRLADIRRIVVEVRASGTAGGRVEVFSMTSDITPRNLRE